MIVFKEAIVEGECLGMWGVQSMLEQVDGVQGMFVKMKIPWCLEFWWPHLHVDEILHIPTYFLL